MYKNIRDWFLEPPKSKDDFDAIVIIGEAAALASMEKSRLAKEAQARMASAAVMIELPGNSKSVLDNLVGEVGSLQIEERELNRFVGSTNLPESKRTALRDYLGFYLNSAREYRGRMEGFLRRENSEPWSYRLLDLGGAAAGFGVGYYFDNPLALFGGVLVGYTAPGGIRRVSRYLSENKKLSRKMEGPRNSLLATLRQ